MTVTARSKSEVDGSPDKRSDAWKELGATQPPFVDDRLAPLVDREFLRRLVREELPEPAAAAACRLILLFASWSQAHQEILAEEGRRR